MKILLRRRSRIWHNAGEIVEVSPAEAGFLFSTGSAVKAPEEIPEAVTAPENPEATIAPENPEEGNAPETPENATEGAENPENVEPAAEVKTADDNAEKPAKKPATKKTRK